ncbi:MAG: plasmid mobilization relaxosome protein MobC [Sphingobacteriaceae bacterium]|nr:MAG: plasmid mobilization relaxosome protein MobC [Sphingobacteriaceae bacterium]
MSEYIRSKALNGKQQVVHGAALLAKLDRVGGELARVGGNINQLAKQANVLNKSGKLDQSIVVNFNILFAEYIKSISKRK